MLNKENNLEKLYKLREQYGTEQVFVVPYSSTQNIPDGLTEYSKENYIDTSKGLYLYRYDVEGSDVLVQIIPSLVISDHTGEKFFVTERIGGEERLRGKLSIIIGGHMNPCDGYIPEDVNMYHNCLLRELKEETTWNSKVKFNSPVWIVRDLKSSTPDHIGYIYCISTSSLKETNKLKIKEKNNLIGKWVDKEFLSSNFHRFESWGQMIIAELLVNKPKNNKEIIYE